MSILVECSGCGANLKVAHTLAGKRCKSAKCATILVIPDTQEDANGIAAEPMRRMKVGGARRKASASEDGDIASKANRITKEGGSSKMLLVGAAVVVLGFGGLVGLGACGGVAWWFFARSSAMDAATTAADTKANNTKAKESSPSKPFWEWEEAKYLPDDLQGGLTVMRFDAIRNSQTFKDINADLGQIAMDRGAAGMAAVYGVTPGDIDLVLVVSPSKPNELNVLRLNKPVQAPDLIACVRTTVPAAVYTETKIGSRTLHEINARGAFDRTRNKSFCILDDKLVLVGEAATLKLILQRGKAPEFSDEMKSLIKAADFDKTFAHLSQDKVLPADAAGLGVTGVLVPQFGLTGNNFANQVRPDAMTFSLTIGNDVRGANMLQFKDANTATDAKTKLEANIASSRQNALLRLPPEAYDIRITVDGNKVLAEQTLSSAALVQMVRRRMGIQ